MSVVKWSPMKELEDMRRDMERVFEEMFEPVRKRRWWPGGAQKTVFVPPMDMYDRKDEVVIKMELPGVRKEDIDLSITRDAINIKGEIKQEEEVPEESTFIRERVFGTFSRMITLPSEVDSAKSKATFKDGVLEIVLPKKEEVIPKEIKVNIG